MFIQLMKITTFPAGDNPPFSEQANVINLMRSVEGIFMGKIFPHNGRVYWIQYSTSDEDSNDDLVGNKESVSLQLDEEEQEDINLGIIMNLVGK